MNKILDHVITVDPGEYTAIAYWKGTIHPEVVQFSYNRINGYVNQLNFMWNRFEILVDDQEINKVFIESTKFYEGNLKSTTAAKKGDLFKLCGLMHGYCAICNKYGIEWEPIQASRWKGQMSKEATANRIHMINGIIYDTEHEMDAVGIGFGVMGMLSWRKEK